MSESDIRYMVPAIPFCIFLTVRALSALPAPNAVRILLGLLLFFTNLANNAVAQSEPMERRAGAEGDVDQQSSAGHRTGKVCHNRWNANDKQQGKGRRNGSPRWSDLRIFKCDALTNAATDAAYAIGRCGICE
jgi:hypothetical protein